MNLNGLHAAAQALAGDQARRNGIMTLGELRAALKVLPAETPVVMDSGESPASLSSYRGYYERLGIGTQRHRDDHATELHRYHATDWYTPGASDVTIAEPVTAAEMVKALDLADGEDFEGYKGGQFEMHGGTWIHAAEHGDCGNAVVGIRIDGDRAVIETAEEEW